MIMCVSIDPLIIYYADAHMLPLSYDIIICRVSPLGIPQRAPAILKQVLHLKERESSGWKEGRKEGRKIGRKEDRKEGR